MSLVQYLNRNDILNRENIDIFIIPCCRTYKNIPYALKYFQDQLEIKNDLLLKNNLNLDSTCEIPLSNNKKVIQFFICEEPSIFFEKSILEKCLKNLTKKVLYGCKGLSFMDTFGFGDKYNKYLEEWTNKTIISTYLETGHGRPKITVDQINNIYIHDMWNSIIESLTTDDLNSLRYDFMFEHHVPFMVEKQEWWDISQEKWHPNFYDHEHYNRSNSNKEENIYEEIDLIDYVKSDLINNVGEGWKKFFNQQLQSRSLVKISTKISDMDMNEKDNIFPPLADVFNAFKICPIEKIKVIIIGQDPYHTRGAAMGLAFSHYPNIKVQPSLVSIFDEMKLEGFKFDPNNGDLSKWATQGVFLINTALTVESGNANCHSKLWIDFIENLFEYLNRVCDNLVVVMWGKHAQSYGSYFSKIKHSILISSHPSPLGKYHPPKPFVGSKPFSKINNLLKENNIEKIDWNLV